MFRFLTAALFSLALTTAAFAQADGPARAGHKGAFLKSGTLTPSSTSSATGVMMGLKQSISPTITGRVLITVTGYLQGTGATLVESLTDLRYGVGTAPNNGASLTGTIIASTATHTACSSCLGAFSLTGAVVGLTPGTPIWIDISLASTNTSAAADITVTAIEF